MISKLLIADVNVSDEVKSLLNSLKGDDVLITYYNYSQGFIVDNKNLLVDKLLTLIRSLLETSTVNFEHLCFMNVEQMKTPAHSSKYNNELHVISNVESKPDALESWNFMGKLFADITKTTEIRNIDFIDIDHLCFPKEHAVIFDKIQEVTKDVEDRTINYLKVAEEDKETIYKSNNWLHAMMTTFYNDENKVLLDKYFKINNSNIGFLNTKILKPRNLQIYDSHVPSIDFESGTLNVSIIPLYCYASDADYDLTGDFIESLNSNTILEFIHITDTMAEFKSRMNHILDKYCGENKDKINKVNVAIWLNPNISNQSLMFSNHISANIDQELLEVVNQLTTNNTENVDQLHNHFVVQVNETFIEYFNMNVYDNMDANIINFEIFNISDTYNTNYNLFCHFLHNDYYVSTLVNFNLTFITSSDITDNLFELSDKIVDFDEEGNIIDVSQSLFKDSQLMTDISNNEAYHDDLFISNTSHINKSIQYKNDINLATYLSSDGPEIDKFMKQNVITNVILYDRELREHLSDVRGCLLPNTLLLTFDKQNTYQDIKDGLLRINELNGVQISNVALFQDNDSRSKTYNFVGEETSIVKYPMMDDPSLNTWSKFQDFVLFLDGELKVKHFDLMMCKIYSNPNWNYVIDAVSSNLSSSLEIRSSENNTGHTLFEGDWILESPVVDVNMINLYFKESIKELDIQLGTYSGIPNPVPTPSEGMVFPKLTDSVSNEISGNLYVSGGKTYISYEITSTSTIKLGHDLNNVDIFIVGGGGGGSGGSAGSGGGAGGVVVGTGINSITSGEYTIAVGEGGAGGTSASSWAAESGGNSVAFGYIAMDGGRGSIAGNGMDGRSIWNIDNNINEDSNGGSGGANETAVGKSTGYHSDTGTFEFTGGSANYNNDSSTYSNVMIYGYNGGGHGGDYKGTSPGGGGAGGVGGNGNIPGGSNYHSGAGGVGMTNNFLNGLDNYYAGGGGGGNLHVGYNEGEGGNGGGGAGGNVPSSGSYMNPGLSGTPNTGGGGGGASAGNGGSNANGGSGGSGIVILRFVLAENENLPAVSSGTEDFSTKIFNYNSGEALASTEDESGNKTTNVFTESTTAYLNYDISVAEIKEYVAPVAEPQSTDISSQIVSLDAGVYNIVVDKPEPPSPPVKYVVFQRVSDNYSRESAIGEIECVLNDNTNIALASNGATAEIYEDFSITDNVASWSTVSTFMASWTNGNYWADKAINGTTTGNFLHINHGTLLVSTVITLQDIHTLDAVQYLYVNNRQNTAYLDRITEHRFVLLDEDKNVVATTNEITVGEVDISFNYSEFNLVNSSEVVDVSTNIVVDLSTNTITSNVDFEIKYTPTDLSLSELTKDTTINPVRSQTIPFVKSGGVQEERSVTLHGDATYNKIKNEYYFPGDLSGYASIEGQLFGEHAMSMSFMYKSGGEPEISSKKYRYVKFETTGTISSPRTGAGLQFFQVDVDIDGTMTPITDASISDYISLNSVAPGTNVLIDYGTDGTTSANSSGNTYWLTGPNGQNSHFTMDLGDLYVISQYRMKNTNNGQYGDRWTLGFKISLSTDGISFVEDIADTILKDKTIIQTFSSTILSQPSNSPPPPIRNTITYIGHPYPSPLNQNAHDTNDFAIYSSPNDQASIFYKEDDTSIKEISSSVFGHVNAYIVTVSSKTSNHPYINSGSSSGYYLNGVESPLLDFVVGETYVFDQSESTNSGHPLKFYTSDDKSSGEYTTDVSINGTAGTAGATTTITITENTPLPLYYQCGSHGFMGYKGSSSNYTHIAITMNEDLTLSETNGFKLYVDGTLTKSGNLSANNGALISGVSQPLQLLGKGPLSGSSESSAFKGYLKNVRFYDSVLSQSEVSTIYTNMITNEYTDNKNFVSQVVPNLVISSSDISSGEHTELTSISMEITSNETITKKNDPNEVVPSTTFKYVVLQRNTDPHVYQPNLVSSQVSIISIVEIECFVNNSNVLLSSNGTNAIWSRDFLVNDNVANVWSDAGETVRYWSWAIGRVPNNAINGNTTQVSHDENAWAHHDDANNPPTNSIHWIATLTSEQSLEQVDYVKLYSGNYNETPHSTYGDQGYRIAGTRFLFLNEAKELVAYTGEITTSVYEHIFNAADIIKVGPEEITVENPSLVISPDDINVVNGVISNLKNSSQNSMSFTFTPSSSNVKSSVSISENSVLDNTINNMTDKPSWFTTNNNHASNVFELMKTDMEMDLMPPLQDQTIAMITSNGSHIEIPVTLNGGVVYDASKNEYDISENGYLSIDEDVIRDGDLTISMMYAMRSGNQYGNDQLVNFSDGNYLDTSTNSTDIHIFRDGTTPGAWFYYGSPDDNGMAISEAGLEPSITNVFTHMAITVKEGQVKQFYINGEVVDYVNKYRSNALPVSRAIVGGKRQHQLFGYGYAANRGFSGLMKNIRIYNKALTSYEMRHLYAINSNFNDNDFSNTTVIPVPRPTLTFSAPLPESKILDSNGAEMTFNSFVKNGKEYKAYSFTNTGTTSITIDRDATDVEILIVGGGGSGGGGRLVGGGGGAGGVVYTLNNILTAGTYNIEVGAGGAGFLPSSIGDGTYGARSGGDSSIKQNGTTISLVNNTTSAIGFGGGGGGTIENDYQGRTGGSGSGPARGDKIGGVATQGNTLYDVLSETYFSGGHDGNTLIGDDPIGKTPSLGMGGGGASSVTYNDGGTGFYHSNGNNGVEIDIGGSVRTVAAGGGGSQFGYHETYHGPKPLYNTSLDHGLGGSNGVGGDGMLWITGHDQAISGFAYPAQYKRIATDGVINTGSGGGGSGGYAHNPSDLSYITSGSGGSGIVIIQFQKPEIASGSSLEQSTLDLTLTASDDGLDGNISSSDIITSNGTITAFSQTSPTTWDLTYTSDYNKQSNVGSLFIEQDAIYNNDVSDIMVPQIETQNFGNSAQTTILNNSYNITGTPSFGWPVLGGNYAVGATNVGGIAGGPIYANPSSGSEPHYVCIFDGIGGTIKYSYFNVSSGVYSHKFRGWKQGFDTNTDYFQNYIDNITTSQLTDIFAGTDLTGYNNGTYYVLAIIQSITSQTQPEPWWTREHNKASNKFEWTALNSGASDTSTTPTRPSITFSSLDLNHGESQNLGTVSMTIYVSSNNLNVEQADLSFSNGVVSNFTKVSNNYYTFDFKSESVSQASTIQVLQDTVSNTETVTDFNEASNVFEWTWSFTVTPPEITITSSDVTHGGNFGRQDVNMLLEFSGEVLHGNSVASTFSQFDVSAENGYAFDISVISQSQIAFKLGSSSFAKSTSVFIPQNIVSRTFNNIYTVNTNNVSNVFTWNYISANLTVSSLVVNDANGNVISAGDYINENELWLQFTFSESIFNFNKSYFDTTNCKIANISSDTTFTTFTVKVETFFPTTASVQVKTDKFITSGRGLQKYVTGANNLSFNWNYDNTKPQISMTSSQASGLTNNVAFVDLSFISTIDTSDFTESSITVTGDASLSNFTTISATEYSVRVTPNSPSSINVSVPVNAYTEQYGNGNENSVSFSWNYDNVPPTVEIFSPDIANGASSSDPYINIYFTLSKPVDDFVLNDDANVANGTLGAMTKTNTFVNHTTTFNVTVATKTASHPYNGSGSSAGYFLNGVESPTIDFIVGQTYTFDQSDSTNSTHPLKFYTTAEKDVLYTSGVVYTDSQGTSGATTTITIDETTPSLLYYQCGHHGFMGFKGVISKKESYTAKLYPTQNDTVSVYIFANSITDSAGNKNTTDSNEFDWIFDSDDLLTTLSSSDVQNNGTFSNDSITISLATTAAIVELVEADISYQNGTISNVDSSAKTFNITSNAQGVPTTAFIIGGAVETSQGESNIESNIFSWTYNPPIPKLVIKSSQINEGDYTNISSIDFTLTFDQENVIFDQNSLSIYNGTISSFSGSGTTYQVTVDTSVASDDLIRLTLPQGNAHVVDNETHYNDVSYNFEWNYDSVAPSITIGSSLVTQDASSTLTSLVLTLNSSEHIDGLRLSDFDVSNGVVSDLTNEGGLEDSSGSSFTFTIQPLDDTTDCSLNICLNANSVVDRAGNTNAKSNDFGYSYIFFSRKLESSAIVELFEDDPEIPQEEKLSSSEIDLVISAAFTIPDTASPFAVAENDSSEQTDGEAIFVKPPKITFPSAIKIKNRKVFTKLIDQIFATASESVKTLTIDKSSVVVAAAAEEQIADVEEIVMVKSNQTEPIDMSSLVEDPTKPSATYIPLANVGDFAIIAIGGVEYTTVVDAEGVFILSSNDGGNIGTFSSNDIYSVDTLNNIIFGSQVISTSAVTPPTVTITSSVLNEGDTTSSSTIEFSYFFSTVISGDPASFATTNCNINSLTTDTSTADNTIIILTVQVTDVLFEDTTIGVSLAANTFYDVTNTSNYNDVSYSFSWIYSATSDSGASSTSPPTLEITSSTLNEGDTTSISTIDLSFVFSPASILNNNSITTTNSNILSLNYDTSTADNTILILTVQVTNVLFEDTTIGVSLAANTFYDVTNTSNYNDVSYSFSWIYSASGGTSDFIPCFLEGTKILTTKGYKNVELLNPKKDKLLDKDNNTLNFLDVQKYSQENNGKQYPYKIPHGSALSEDYTCNRDLYLTYNHCVYLPHLNKFAPVSAMKHIKEDKSLTQKKFTYYHIFTENYFSDTLMANGIPCESHSKYTFAKLRNIDPSDKLLRSVIKKADMLPNCMRNRLSIKEMKQLVKKFNRKQNKRKIKTK